MSTPQRSKLLHALRTWKEKAIARRAQVNALKKRIAELTQSRDAWKMKAQIRQQQITELHAENARLAACKPPPEKKNAPCAISIASTRFKRSLP